MNGTQEFNFGFNFATKKETSIMVLIPILKNLNLIPIQFLQIKTKLKTRPNKFLGLV
jgi:hypothetical protein